MLTATLPADGTVKRITYLVSSNSGNGNYTVSADPRTGRLVSCTCKGFQYRATCNHLTTLARDMTARPKPRITFGPKFVPSVRLAVAS